MIVHPESAPPPINPESWVSTRAYEKQNFQFKLVEWTSERNTSLKFLGVIRPEDHDIGFTHNHFGRFTVGYLMEIWLTLDLLHIGQLTRMRYYYLSAQSSHSLEYAGKW